MRRTTQVIALMLAPALVTSQQTSTSTHGGSRASASATVTAEDRTVVNGEFSAETRARLEAMFRKAEQKDLPTEPMQDRVSEGDAKGAAEGRIVSAAAEVMSQLELAQSALVSAGREPSGEEIARGASVIAQGASHAELQAFARGAPSERSLVVAFEVLSDLLARGIPVDNALAEIGGRLEARASDAQLRALGVELGGQAQAGTGLRVGSGKTGTDIGGSVTGAVRSTLGLGLGRRP